MVIHRVLFLVLCLSAGIEAQKLQVGFYRSTCIDAESTVREEVRKGFEKDKGIAPGLVRMHFHDCMGCDSSILVDSTPTNMAEKDGPPNGITLRGFEVIDSAKARLEALPQCKGVVSCADILAFAARDATVITAGFGWDVPAGRRDGRISQAPETLDIPAPFFNLDQLTQAFAKKGLTQEEMVILSGAHTIGRSHCFAFINRLYFFSPTNGQDPSLDLIYAAQLKRQCPRGPDGSVDPNLVVPMNFSPVLMDQNYYLDVLWHRGLFTSDQTLTTSLATTAQVKEYAFNGLRWKLDFAQAMVKMSQIEVLTGTAGEIRANCRVINP
ncbi:peroxidase 5-like [Cornus florida]|uniref:peroxidase 5-like n=1 Tax=Cornus florida TaxID=4283 RepID=UPI00289E4026|nr:peroxidase 5-like [Cornus florida]